MELLIGESRSWVVQQWIGKRVGWYRGGASSRSFPQESSPTDAAKTFCLTVTGREPHHGTIERVIFKEELCHKE